MYRCEWGAGFATTPTMMSATRVRCASYLHAAPAERRLQLSLNTIDYTPLAPSFGYGRTFRLPVCPSASPLVCPFAPQPLSLHSSPSLIANPDPDPNPNPNPSHNPHPFH